MPQVLGMVKNPHYLYRMTVLLAIASLASYVSPDVFVGTMLPVLVGCAKDRVPNVKFNVAKVLERVAPLVDNSVVQQTIKPCLSELCDDPDADVQFFARQALHACDGMQVA